MASGDILGRIASQDTSEEIRDRIGNTGDTGGSPTAGTVTSKVNAALLGIGGVNNGIDGLNSRLDGMVTPYGKGTYGDLIVGSDFVWPSQDGFNRYVIHTKSMTIPEGITLKPPEKCDGVYILSQGDVTINGDIDVRGMRKTFDADLQLAPTINVGSQTFVLAKGGYAPVGGASGAGGKALVPPASNSHNGSSNIGAPSKSPEKSIAGNINGGGVGEYATGGVSTIIWYYSKNDLWYTVDYNDSWAVHPSTKITEREGAIKISVAPTAVIIIAKGTVTINGKILATATDGVNATDGGLTAEQAPLYGASSAGVFTRAGTGAIAPSGGGAVTIICNQFVNNGEVDTNGKKLVSPNGTDNRTVQVTGRYLYGSEGGKGGTFISTAGEIKVYTGVSE